MKLFYLLGMCALFPAFAAAEMPHTDLVKLTPRTALAKSKTAKSGSDFEELATFYRHQEELFSLSCKQQEQAYEYAVGHWGGKSYPQSADRARLLADYYRRRCLQSKLLADTYTRKAESQQKHSD